MKQCISRYPRPENVHDTILGVEQKLLAHDISKRQWIQGVAGEVEACIWQVGGVDT